MYRTGIQALIDNGYTERDINMAGFEKWTLERADREYFETFGVRSPNDPDYNPTVDNVPLACLFD